MKNDIRLETANSKTILCKDCVHRDKSVITLRGKERPVGINRCQCEVYVYPAIKPSAVMYSGGDCEFYEREENAVSH